MSAATDGLAESAAAVAAIDKEFATMRATMALHGFELQIIGDDIGGTAYMVHRWSHCRMLPDLPAVRRFAEQAGVNL